MKKIIMVVLICVLGCYVLWYKEFQTNKEKKEKVTSFCNSLEIGKDFEFTGKIDNTTTYRSKNYFIYMEHSSLGNSECTVEIKDGKIINKSFKFYGLRNT